MRQFIYSAGNMSYISGAIIFDVFRTFYFSVRCSWILAIILKAILWLIECYNLHYLLPCPDIRPGKSIIIFQDRVMINISCMLVIATIQAKISQILPKTSYFKLIGSTDQCFDFLDKIGK